MTERERDHGSNDKPRESIDIDANIRRAWFDKARVMLREMDAYPQDRRPILRDIAFDELLTLLRSYVHCYEGLQREVGERDVTIHNLTTAITAMNQTPRSAVVASTGHEGDKPTRERIVQAHSFFPASAAFPNGYATGHRPYYQGRDEACYICTCLAEIDRLERELGVQSATERRIKWVDDFDCENSMTEELAAQTLKEFFDEWPGGLDEIESALNGHRELVLEAAALMKNVPAAKAFLEKYDGWLKAVAKATDATTDSRANK